jgi:ATP-dependent protease ClpP protease subunit
MDLYDIYWGEGKINGDHGTSNSRKRKRADAAQKSNSDANLNRNEVENYDCDLGDLVRSHENEVHFYADINYGSIIALQREIQRVIDRIVTATKSAEQAGLAIGYPHIKLYISSPGGGIFAAFNFIGYMTEIKIKYPQIKFHSIVMGRAASAATLISVVADERSISEHSFMLIHQLSSAVWGKYRDIKDGVLNLDVFMEKIKNIYRKYTKVPNNKIDEILDHDLYWDAETCKNYGLVDSLH